MIQPNGTLNLPVEMMTLLNMYGHLWEFTTEVEGDGHIIKARPSAVKGKNGDSFKKCPVCKVTITEKDSRCLSCGAMLLD